MVRRLRALALAASVLGAAPAFAAGGLPALPESSPDRYLQTNLHFDGGGTEISSIHYLRGGLLKRCTRVTLGPLTKNRLTVTAGGTEYLYVFAGHTPRPWEAHLQKLFGRTCDPGAVRRMSAIDQKGIQQGEALVGMTKEGVKLALGIPPEHATPSLDADTWVYWQSRFNKLAVVFQKGKVVQVKG
jgi:hypothetical protein